jgi:hypothetical protein
MGIERPDEGDAPAAGHGRRAAGMPAPAFQYETRDRQTYDAQYRAAVEAEYRAAGESRDGVAPQLRDAWADHEKKWPSPERQREPSRPDIPGAWRGDGGRCLDPEANAEVDRGCERIREAGQKIITPALKQIEAQDPERKLAGLEHHIKEPDRLKEKVADQLRSTPSLRPEQALSVIPDAVRFTFKYDESTYTAGVRADIQRLEDAGFVQIERRNTWTSEQYRGLNSRWREPRSWQLFEVQFHTEASFEAKQLTHPAYERLRNPMTTDDERDELYEFQRQACRKIPVPPGAAEIENYQLEQRDGRGS